MNIVNENDTSDFIWQTDDFDKFEVRVTTDNLKEIIVANSHDFIDTVENIVKKHKKYVKRVKNLKQKNSKLTTKNQKLNLIINTLKKNKKVFEAKIVKSKKKKHKLMNAFTKIQSDFDEIKNANNAKQISIDTLNKEIDDFLRKQKKQSAKQAFATIKQTFAASFSDENIDDVINKVKLTHQFISMPIRFIFSRNASSEKRKLWNMNTDFSAFRKNHSFYSKLDERDREMFQFKNAFSKWIDVKKFTDDDKTSIADFEAWKNDLLTKIRRDSRAFRNSEFNFDYAKTRVKDIARSFVSDRIEFNNVHLYDSLEKLMNDLDLHYSDDNKKTIAMLKLKNSTFKQKYNENFINFVTRLNEIINSIEFIDI